MHYPVAQDVTLMQLICWRGLFELPPLYGELKIKNLSVWCGKPRKEAISLSGIIILGSSTDIEVNTRNAIEMWHIVRCKQDGHIFTIGNV